MESGEVEASYVPGDATVKSFSEQQFGSVTSPCIVSYVFHAADVDKDYDMRRDSDGTFSIGNYAVQIDRNTNVVVKGYLIKVPMCYLN